MLWTPFIILVVAAAPSAAVAQWPGPGNPGQGRQALPPVNRPGAILGLPSQEPRRDDRDLMNHAHIITHGLGHLHLPSGSAQPEQMRNVPTPRIVVPPEAMAPVSQLHHTPLPRFTPVVTEGSSSMARGLSHGGGGILAGIGGAIAAVFGGLFGRKKES
jgi:hypothetical protein